MIPNAGLDNIAAYPAWRYYSGNVAPTSGEDWLGYAAISEDSQEPLATDTNIGTERARTNSTGSFNRTITPIRDPDSNRLSVSIERAYVFDITGNWNITKYGYVPVSSGGNFSWIDLVRSDPNDPQSQPVTLTLEPGDQLQLWCTFTVTVPWSVDLEQFVITGAPGNDTNGTHDAYCGFIATGTTIDSPSYEAINNLIAALFWPGSTGNLRAFATSGAVTAARDAPLATSTGSSSNARVNAAYASGAYFRDRTYTFSTATANYSITGIALTTTAGIGAPGAGTGYGFKIVFDNPATFDKANTHELTLTFRVSWQEG